MIAILLSLSAIAGDLPGSCLLIAGAVTPRDPIVILSRDTVAVTLVDTATGQPFPFRTVEYVSPASGERVTIVKANLHSGGTYSLDCGDVAADLKPVSAK